MASLIDETGNTYHRLTAISRSENDRQGQAHWLCRCVCGKELTIAGRTLRSGHTKSCGCLKHDLNSLSDGVAARNKLLYVYKRNARTRGYSWELTDEQFDSITSMQCHYCGIEPMQVQEPEGDTGVYIYNGIDRKDNSKGYVIDNVIPCCGRCNTAKMSMDYEQFLDWTSMVYHNRVCNETVRIQ